MVSTERWLSRKDAAAELGVHPRTLDRLVRESRLPRYYLGTRTPRFRIEDVRAVPVPNGGLR
jgi:excisionase family DNA binding protein